jgi:hypothetical protein
LAEAYFSGRRLLCPKLRQDWACIVKLITGAIFCSTVYYGFVTVIHWMYKTKVDITDSNKLLNLAQFSMVSLPEPFTGNIRLGWK